VVNSNQERFVQNPRPDAPPHDERTTKRVWDVPVRIAHLAFIASLAGAWLTRGAEHADWHAAFGYTALAAVALRIVWGFVGPAHARFASFAYSPMAAARYVASALRGAARHYTGHNPAGSWAVYLLLALIAATCASGVIASAGMHGLGPLAGWIGFAAGDAAFGVHEVLAWIVLGVAAMHVLGVIWGSYVHRENLALAMVTGRKVDHGDGAPSAPARTRLGLAFALAAIAGSAGYLGYHVPHDVQRRVAGEARAEPLVAALPWSKECGSCHLAFPAALLPLRSWERMLAEQDKHFGEDLSLSSAAAKRLLDAARATATLSWGEWALASSVAPGAAPQRITELARWRTIHARVADERFKSKSVAGRYDCGACHRDAASGIFHPRMIQEAKRENGS
jgi:cytochrome b